VRGRERVGRVVVDVGDLGEPVDRCGASSAARVDGGVEQGSASCGQVAAWLFGEVFEECHRVIDTADDSRVVEVLAVVPRPVEGGDGGAQSEQVDAAVGVGGHAPLKVGLATNSRHRFVMSRFPVEVDL